MINKLLRTLGPTKGTFAITGFAILFSTVLYLISCIFYGGIYAWGLIKAAIIPAIAAPIPSYLLLRVAIRLALSEENLWKSEKKYKQLYEESKRAEEVYRSLLHSSADAIVMYDLEGNTQYISPAFTQIFGWTMAEVKGKQIPFLPDSERAATMAGAKEIMKDGKRIQGFETRRYSKDGRLIDVSISGSRYNDHEGKPAGMLVTLRDISETKKMEMQLHLAQKVEAIGTLAGGIAHDFNNLLMGIEGNTSLMLYDIDSSHPHYRPLKNIEKQIKSAANLTAQLLGYARKGKYKVQPISLNILVEETATHLAEREKTLPFIETCRRTCLP